MAERPSWDELRAREQRLVNLGKTFAEYKRNERTLSPLGRMHLRHGKGPEGTRCGDCAHLFRHSGDYAGEFFKCHEYGWSNGAATDWRLKYPACGLFARRKEGSDG